MNLDMRINGTTKLTGLIGNPVGHTVSPILHNSLLSALGINGIYVPLAVPADSLKEAVKGLKACSFTGFNVTIPYKEEILEYVDGISEEVKLLGVANTVKILDGRLYAFNTDGDGFLRSFREQTETGFVHKHVCLLGAGGTAKALAVKIAMEGAAKISIINRTLTKAVELASAVNKVVADIGCSETIAIAVPADTSEALQMQEACDIIVNTTSVGMYPDVYKSPLQQDVVLKSRQIVYDVIYNPSHTKLLAHAKDQGCITVNGAGMLFYQGVKAFEIWMDITVPKEITTSLSTNFLKYLKV